MVQGPLAGGTTTSGGRRTSSPTLKRINRLVGDARRDPTAGIGKPEPLHHVLAGSWSRRIDEEHRLVHLVDGEASTSCGPATATRRRAPIPITDHRARQPRHVRVADPSAGAVDASLLLEPGGAVLLARGSSPSGRVWLGLEPNRTICALHGPTAGVAGLVHARRSALSLARLGNRRDKYLLGRHALRPLGMNW